MRFHIVAAGIWAVTISAAQAAPSEADILRPETAESLAPLWSLAEGDSRPTDNQPAVTPSPSANLRPGAGNILLQRDAQQDRTGYAVPLSLPPKAKASEKKAPETKVTKVQVPVMKAMAACPPIGSRNGKNPSRSTAKELTIWFSRLSHAVQAGLKASWQRREAIKTRRLLALSRQALLGFVALQPRETPPDITGAAAKVSYARGVMAGTALLGNEALLARSGAKHDIKILLAGIRDVFNRQVRLSGSGLAKAQQQVIGELQKAERTARDSQAAAEKRFVVNFRQRRGVRPGGKGVWYRVDQAGRRSGLDRSSVIPLVAKEMLTDGTVLGDMQAEKKILNTTLSDLPLPWQKAVEQAGYGGAVTVVQDAGGGTQPVRVYMIRTFDPHNYVFPGRNPTGLQVGEAR